jgi:methyltransferase-like protein/2-polyprenyl-3-methyl-5-hydroxy-6-metoxy-1,4-benzoquinol methylase
MSGAVTSYDEIPYPRYSFPQTHPERLAAVATLFGLAPPAVERCRVLELGCAGGSNLVPMAEGLPSASFLGIDLSQRQISEGQAWIKELGLDNVELRHQSILDFDTGGEKFDYIVCHGVYSWVPPEVQDRLLHICQQCLRPDGVAYVSWNTLPGWHMRGMIRDMMLYHGRRFAEPRQQLIHARALLGFLASSTRTEENPYSQFLRSELEQLRQQPDGYLYHDHLEDHNHPVYLHQFVKHAGRHKLRYLADVDLYTMDLGRFTAEVREVLKRLTTDLIQIQQYIDFLKNRTFSQTLLVHADQRPDYRTDPDVVKKFIIAAPLKPDSPTPKLQSSDVEHFRTRESSASTPHPIAKAALLVLAEAWPAAIPFGELLESARARLSDRRSQDPAMMRKDERLLCEVLLKFFISAKGLVEFRLRPLHLATHPGERPLARPLARSQARNGIQVTNLRHESVTLNDFSRQLLLRLDGKTSREELLRQMAELVERDGLPIPGGAKANGPGQVEALLVSTIGQHISLFMRKSLLLA